MKCREMPYGISTAFFGMPQQFFFYAETLLKILRHLYGIVTASHIF